MTDALTIAKALMHKDADGQNTNTKDGNKIINKLLYFAQLISLSKYGEKLFENDLYAFQEGCVVEDVRKEYYKSYHDLKAEASLFEETNLTLKEKDVLEEVMRLFGDFSAEELSEITHGHKSWIENYEGSRVGEYFYKERQKIDTNSLIENEVPWISNFLADDEEDDEDGYVMKINNGIVFYYNPDAYTEEEIVQVTKDFNGVDKVYTIVKEYDGKAVIY